MKNSFYRLLTYGVIVIFLLYWAGVLILLMPPNKAKEAIKFHAPRFKNMFENTWKLFTPPYKHHYRLYYVLKDTGPLQKTDTLEVLEQISLNKQKAAPFNQREHIIDYFVNNNVTGLLRIVYQNKKRPEDAPGTTDSLYIANAIASAGNNKFYITYLGNLKNYCKEVLKQKNIDTTGRELKIIIKGKPIRPFKERNNPNYVETETLVFETPFKPLHP